MIPASVFPEISVPIAVVGKTLLESPGNAVVPVVPVVPLVPVVPVVPVVWGGGVT